MLLARFYDLARHKRRMSDKVKLITVNEFAKRSDLKPRAARRLIASGNIPAYRFSARIQRVNWSEALNKCKVRPAAADV